MHRSFGWLGASAALALLLAVAGGRADEEKISLDKLPNEVKDAVLKRFPKAELKGAEKETDKGKTYYEVALIHKEQKIEVTLTEKGEIVEIEKIIAAKDLPKAVKKALDDKYPKATFKTIEEVIKVTEGKEKTTKYGVVLVTADKKAVAVSLDPDGKIQGAQEAAEAGEEKVPLDKLPKAVKDAVLKRFPKADLKSAEKENENGKIVYEVAIVYKDQKIEVTLTPEGKITEIEKQIAAKDMPKEVTKTLEDKYPKATYKMIEEVIKVKDNKEKLEYYEVLLETADKKKFEVSVAPDGKVVKVEDKNKKKEEK
jgi:uncharacterized membrane protein YkoI